MSSVLILGAGVMQGPAIQAAQKMGYRAVVADGNNKAPLIDRADQFLHIDLVDYTSLITAASRLEDLRGVITAGTDFSFSVAKVAEALGLPGISPDAALRASDKAYMRKTLQAAGIPVPAFISGCHTDNPVILLQQLQAEKAAQGTAKLFPLVVKPVDNMGGRGCRLVASDSELLAAWLDALEHSRTKQVIIEDYIEGPEFSIDALVHEGRMVLRGIADRHIYFQPYFIEMGHTIPSQYSPEILAEIMEVFTRAAAALGITRGAAKGDMKYTSHGPVVGEIAARLSGGYMSGWTYPLSSGINPIEDALAIACGLPPLFPEQTRNLVCAERAFISIDGTVASVHAIPQTSDESEGVRNLFMRCSAGSKVQFPLNNVQKCGNILAVASDANKASAIAEQAARKILVRLQSHNPETDNFLAAYNAPPIPGISYDWPPRAYPNISAMTLGLVAAMPDLMRQEATPRTLSVAPLKSLASEQDHDWQGRSLEEALAAVQTLCAVKYTVEADVVLGRCFWQALFNGGYQAAAYIVDCTKKEYGIA